MIGLGGGLARRVQESAAMLVEPAILVTIGAALTLIVRQG